MENKLTQLDPSQIIKTTYDEHNNAQRVYLVNGPDSIQMGFTEKTSTPYIQTIEIPKIVYETLWKEIQVPVYITKTEIKEIQVPVIVKELEIKEIERQILIPSEPQFQIIEKEIVPKRLKYILIAQLFFIGILLGKLIF